MDTIPISNMSARYPFAYKITKDKDGRAASVKLVPNPAFKGEVSEDGMNPFDQYVASGKVSPEIAAAILEQFARCRIVK
jgi:hypothetical protein